jgi:regulator of sirC expression with transglutaminase-like and TPR domain
MSLQPTEYLAKISTLKDDDIDLARTALALAAMSHLGLSLDRYENHLDKISTEVKARFEELTKAGAEDSAETKLAALKHIIADKHGYTGALEEDGNLQNSSIIRTIDRGKGLPITLSILYIHAGRAMGWDAGGIHMPGYFLCRLQAGSSRLIFDPAQNCKIMQASDLRAVLKQNAGPKAELLASYFEPLSNREILIRLQNTVKSRQIEMEDYEGALRTVELMRGIDPGEYRLLLDAGVLYARTERLEAAIDALEEYISKAPNDRDRHDAAMFLQQIRDKLE